MEHINWGHVIAAFFTGGGIFAGVMKFAASFGEGGFFNPVGKMVFGFIEKRHNKGEQAMELMAKKLDEHKEQDKLDFEGVRDAMANGEKNTLSAIQTIGERMTDKLDERLGELHEKINDVTKIAMETKGQVSVLIEMKKTG